MATRGKLSPQLSLTIARGRGEHINSKMCVLNLASIVIIIIIIIYSAKIQDNNIHKKVLYYK